MKFMCCQSSLSKSNPKEKTRISKPIWCSSSTSSAQRGCTSNIQYQEDTSALPSTIYAEAIIGFCEKSWKGFSRCICSVFHWLCADWSRVLTKDQLVSITLATTWLAISATYSVVLWFDALFFIFLNLFDMIQFFYLNLFLDFDFLLISFSIHHRTLTTLSSRNTDATVTVYLHRDLCSFVSRMPFNFRNSATPGQKFQCKMPSRPGRHQQRENLIQL